MSMLLEEMPVTHLSVPLEYVWTLFKETGSVILGLVGILGNYVTWEIGQVRFEVS